MTEKIVWKWRKVMHEWIRCSSDGIVRGTVHDITGKWSTETDKGQVTTPYADRTIADSAKSIVDRYLGQDDWTLRDDLVEPSYRKEYKKEMKPNDREIAFQRANNFQGVSEFRNRTGLELIDALRIMEKVSGHIAPGRPGGAHSKESVTIALCNAVHIEAAWRAKCSRTQNHSGKCSFNRDKLKTMLNKKLSEALRACYDADPKCKSSIVPDKKTLPVCETLAELGLMKQSYSFMNTGGKISNVKTFRVTAAGAKTAVS